MIKFVVYGEPTAKGRPKFTNRGGFGRAYTPEKTQQAEQSFQYQSLKYKPYEPLRGALALSIRVFRRKGRPASKIGAQRAESGIIRPVTKPDLDNYVKLVKDAMNGLFWHDDAQVVEIAASKWFSETARIEVEVKRIETSR